MKAVLSYTVLIEWGPHPSASCHGWMFRMLGKKPEPCPEDAWKLGPTIEACPKVAEILAREGELVLVFVQSPTLSQMVYVYTPGGGGIWRSKTTLLMGRLGKSLAVQSLFEVKTA